MRTVRIRVASAAAYAIGAMIIIVVNGQRDEVALATAGFAFMVGTAVGLLDLLPKKGG